MRTICRVRCFRLRSRDRRRFVLSLRLGAVPFFFLPAWLRAGVSLETPALSPVTGRFGRRGRRRKHACPNKTKVRPASPNTPQNRGQGQRLPGAVAVRLVFPYTKSGRRRPDRRKKDAGFEHNLPAGLQYYSGDRGR